MRPRPFEVPKSGDPFAHDTLGRKDQIEALTLLLRNIEGPCVLAIDAPWGAGKTAFLQMWAQHLRRERFRVAEFNAWETDFSDDPLIALYAALEGVIGRRSSERASNVLKAGATMLSRLTSTAATAVTGLPVPDAAEMVTAVTGSSVTSTKARLERHRDAETSIRDFKKALERATKGGLPLVISIDELDRCRPDYAIRLLESTKHIFDVDGVVFILGVNLSELAHSVNAMYGNSFSSEVYLNRFLDRRIYLPKPDRSRFLDELLGAVGMGEHLDKGNFVRLFLDSYVLGASDISLRDIEQAVFHLGMAISSVRGRRSWSGFPLDMVVVTLMLMRVTVPNTYLRFIRGEVSDLDALTDMNSTINRSSDWWRGRNHDQASRVGARMEAILAGWGNAIGSAHGGQSLLLQKRQQEVHESDDDYPSTVINTAAKVQTIEIPEFMSMLSIIEMITYDPASDS